MSASLHALPVSATRLQARRQVIGLGRLQPLGAKEIQLLPNTLIHGFNHGASFVRAFLQVVGEIRNV